MKNAQGIFNDGRGDSGLNAVTKYRATTRLGTGTPRGYRPARLTGKPSPIKPNPFIRVMTPPKPRPGRAATMRNRRQFVNWIKRWAPQLYLDAKKRADVDQALDGTLNGLGGWWESFTESLTSVGGKYLQFRTQKDILDAQMERMAQGLPPLQTSEYAPTIAVKPDAGTTAEITGAIGAGFGRFIPWAAAGVGVYLLLGRKK